MRSSIGRTILGVVGVLVAAGLCLNRTRAQDAVLAAPPALRTTFVRLSNSANALIYESAVPDPQRNRFAVLIAHPDHVNTFGYFIAPELARRGYRVMTLNYYGPEEVYDEFLTPLAAAVNYLRSQLGVQKVVLAGHSTGGAELTYYQDVAENGQKACDGPERVYPCRGPGFDHLPAADGVMIIDSSAGALERLIALDPSVGARPREHRADVDLFNPSNGFDARTQAGAYSTNFERRYLQAQGERQMRLISQAQARLAKIEKGQGDYKDDEPFIVPGSSVHTYDGARIDLADLKITSRTHSPHVLLKADGSRPMQIIPSTRPGLAEADQMDKLDATTQDVTVRHFLTFLAIRTGPSYALTADRVTGVEWRSVPNSIPGNVQGIRVPTLFMSGTCAPHLVFTEIAYELSAAKDKEFVGVEGGNHYFVACKPEYGNPAQHAFDYMDEWLMKPGRF